MKKQTLQMRDYTMRPGFTQIQNIVLRDGLLSSGDKLMYALLLSYAWQQDFCFPGQKALANDMGCDSRTVRRHLSALIKRGLVSEQRRGLSKTNVYVIEPLTDVYSEADRTEMSAQDETLLSATERTPVSDKEYPVEKDTVKKTQRLSRNPYIAEMQKALGFPEKTNKDPIPNPAKEANFIKKMIERGFDWGAIWNLWADKVEARNMTFVSMQWVNEDIGKDNDNGKDRRRTTGFGAERLSESLGKPLS